jgi:DNA methylase
VVWGGEPCEHVWGADQRTPWANSVPGPNGRGGKNGDGRRNETKSTGPFCSRCGAWRGSLGLEPTYQLYVSHMVEVARAIRRVLRKDGVFFLNLGDSYATGAGKVGAHPGGGTQGAAWAGRGIHTTENSGKHAPRITAMGPMTQPNRMPQPGLKPKDLCGIPWRVAFALQEDGWYLRKALPWLKRNPMPESTTDRPTTAVEYVFLLARSERYFWDAEAVARKASPNTNARMSQDVANQVGSTRANGGDKTNGNMKAVIKRPKRAAADSGIRANDSFENATCQGVLPTRNMRDADLFFDSLEPPFGLICDTAGEPLAIDATTQPFKEAHFATFAPRLIEPLIKAGSSEKGCCAKCGAPWKRETRRIDQGWDGSKYGERAVAASGGAISGGTEKSTLGSSNGKLVGVCETVGWSPSCKCDADVVPCTILDPFGGAGTTGLVADRLQRNAILIELNPDYSSMAKRRVYDDAPLFADAAE